MSVSNRLVALEKDFDPAMGLYGARLNSIGYHTSLPDGTWVHHTRRNLDFAYELLASGDPKWIERARGIIRTIISLQDQDPVSPTYGIWSWHAEEPLSQMSPPDWNWADFLGLKLAEILSDYRQLLPPDLAMQAEVSLRHAAQSIFRRNMGPHYTNIAIKGGCVAVAAGEILGEDWLMEYGQLRLRGVVAHHDEHGGFNEYNSPTYTRLVLGICETGLRIIQNQTARAEIDRIRCLAWEAIAAHFHPGTRQLCGPQSRSYHDFLPPDVERFIGVRTGLWGEDIDRKPGPPCPEHHIERFRSLPSSPLESHHSYIRRATGGHTTGTSWFTQEACIGSVSADTTWNQRRPVLAYWKDDEGHPVALRLRMLRDGKDFASGFVWNVQNGPRVLSVVGLIADGGDFHPFFDRPENGIFEIQDLRVRYELTGRNLRTRSLDEHRFELASGTMRAVIHTAASRFEGRPIQWQLEEADGKVFLDAIWPLAGNSFNVHTIGEAFTACAVELLTAAEQPTDSPVLAEPHPTDLLLTRWAPAEQLMELDTPIKPVAEETAHQYGSVSAAPVAEEVLVAES